MADVIINDIYLSAIADAIRAKLGTESTYTPPNMASAIRSISGGGSSGSYRAKTVDPSTSQQIVNPDTGYDALSSVTVNAMPSGTAGTPVATKGTTNQTIASGTYLTGTQTIAGDADLIAGNIKAGVGIFNVTGTFTSDATAAAADIVDGETAYVNGSKVTGTLVIQNVYVRSGAPTSSIGDDGDIYIQE